jgi:ABC-type multidrug transport system permease subunit
MRAALLIAGHHLYRMARNPGLVLLLAAIPLTLALIEYAAFGPTVASGKLPPIRVLFVDEDDTLASGAVPQSLQGGPLKDVITVTRIDRKEDARRPFERNQASALVVVPKGFQDALLDGQGAELQLYKNPVQTIAPGVVESVVDMLVVLGNGLIGRATIPLARIRVLADQDRDPTSDEVAEISRGFFEAGQSFGRLSGINSLGVTVERPAGPQESGLNVDPRAFFAALFPGLVLFGVMLISQSLAQRLMRDRLAGLERRLRSTPASSAAVSLGGMIYLSVGLLVLLLVMFVIGALVFRIALVQPVALLAFGLAFAGFAAGLQLSVNALARSDRGAASIANVVVMLLTLLGGNFVPAESLPPFFQGLARLLPNGASQQAMADILGHGGTLAGQLPRLAVVLAFAVVFLTLAFVSERRRAIA